MAARQPSIDTPTPSKEDQMVVGSRAILQSAHVSEGPGRIANAPVPSVFNDDRGTIDRLRVGGSRVNILYSKAAVMRSGYLHPETKYAFVISGQVELWILTKKGTEKRVYGKQECFEIPQYTPHVVHFLENCVTAEWWEQPGETRCWYYHPYRNVVDVQNSLLSKSAARHSVLIPQNDFDRLQQQPHRGVTGFLWLSAGTALGVCIGVFMAKNNR